MHNFSAIVGHQRLKRYGRNEKRSDEVVKVINRDERGAGGGGDACGAVGPEMQQSTIHVTLATTKSGIHPGTIMAQSCFNQFNVTYLP